MLARTVPDRRVQALPLSSGPMPHTVTLIPGDGTGPELTEATRRVLEATGVAFDVGRAARPAST